MDVDISGEEAIKVKFYAVKILLFALLYLWLMPTAFAEAEVPQGIEEAQQLMNRAESWYLLGSATVDDLDAYEYSLQSYEEALALLEGQEASEADTLRRQAEAGKSKLRHRIDNISSMYRNAIHGVWWIAGDDPTAISHGDPVSTAVSHAVDPIVNWVNHNTGGATQPLMVIRIRDRLAPGDLEAHGVVLKAVRDGALNQLESQTSAVGLSEIQGLSLLGDRWARILDPTTKHEEILNAMSPHADADELLIVDLTAQDYFYRDQSSQSVPIWRFDGVANLWDLESGEHLSVISTEGLAQDQNDRFGHIIFWAFIMLFVASALVTISWRLEERTHRGAQVGLAVASLLAIMVFVVGMSLTATASQFTASFIPDWGYETFLFHLGPLAIPHPNALLWQLVHGAFVMLGPMIALGWATLKIPAIAPYLVPEGIEPERLLALVGPFAQAGASTWLFGLLLLAEPNSLTATALPLGVAACLCGFALVRPMADLLAGDTDTGKKAMAATLGGVGLLLIMPFGLYINWAWPTGILVSMMAIASSFLSFMSTPSTQSVKEEKEAEQAQASGTMECPNWVPTVDIDQISKDVEAGRHIKLESPIHPSVNIRAGVSRAIYEIIRVLEEKKVKILHLDPGSEELSAFSLMTQILELLDIGDSNLSLRLNQREMAVDAFGNLDGLVSDLPGVGAIFGLLDQESDHVSIQRERIISDGAKLLAQGLNDADVDLVIIEDLQIADDSSLEILRVAIERHAPDVKFILAYQGQSAAELSGLIGALRDVSPHQLEPFSEEQARDFIQACGIRELPDDIIDVVHRGAKGYPGSMHSILQALVRDDLLIHGEIEGTLRPSPILSLTKVRQAYDELDKAERRRIAELSSEDRLILECGALSGRHFSIEEISAGLERSPVEVTAKLRDLEASDAFPIIQDTQNAEGLFNFSSSVTREVLIEELGDQTENRRELARTIHDRIARAPSKYAISLVRRLNHAMRAGHQATPLVINIAADLLEKYTRQCAWPELKETLARIDHVRGLGDPSDETRIDLAECFCLRVIGGQDNRDRLNKLARQRLTHRIEDGYEDGLTFRVAYTWCEGVFEENQAEDKELLRDVVSNLVDEVTDMTLNQLFRFYRVLANFRGNENLATSLDTLADIESVIRSKATLDQRNHQLLLSMVTNTRGNWLWRSRGDDPEKRKEIEKQAIALLDEAGQLKEEIGDYKGLAMNYGIRGSNHLFDRYGGPDSLAKARYWLEKDLELIDKHGIESDRSTVENKLSFCLLQESKGSDPKETKERLQKAAYYADRAFDDARSLERETDLAYAAKQRIDVWIQARKKELASPEETPRINEIMTTMADQGFWQQVGSGHIKGVFPESARQVMETIDNEAWVSSMEEVLDYLADN